MLTVFSLVYLHTPWKKNPIHNASYIVMAGIGETFKVF